MEKNFDLIVIGTGSAGSTVAHKCRKAGWDVAIIDSRPFGGTCAVRGCDPKKVLVGAADGDLSLPIWVDHVGSKTRWQQYKLIDADLTANLPEGAWTTITRPEH